MDKAKNIPWQVAKLDAASQEIENRRFPEFIRRHSEFDDMPKSIRTFGDAICWLKNKIDPEHVRNTLERKQLAEEVERRFINRVSSIDYSKFEIPPESTGGVYPVTPELQDAIEQRRREENAMEWALRDTVDFEDLESRLRKDFDSFPFSDKDQSSLPGPDLESVTQCELDIAKGPAAPNLFRWQGVSVELQSVPWRLVRFLWGSPNYSAEVEDVIEAVWGHDSHRTPEALKSAINRANSRLDEKGLPVDVVQKNGNVLLKFHE